MPSKTTPVAQKLAGGLSLTHLILTIALSVGGTLFTVGVTQGSFAQRLTATENTIVKNKADRDHVIEKMNEQIVPRAEQEAHWKAQDEVQRLQMDILKSIQADVREVRSQVNTKK